MVSSVLNDKPFYEDIIPQEEPKVKKQLKKDSLGNELSAEQQAFFKDSKVRDEDGNLLVVYHGTDADFTVFEKRNGMIIIEKQ